MHPKSKLPEPSQNGTLQSNQRRRGSVRDTVRGAVAAGVRSSRTSRIGIAGTRRRAGGEGEAGPAEGAPITDRLSGSGLARSGGVGIAGAGVAAVSQFLVVFLVTRGVDARDAGVFFTTTATCLMVAGVLRLDAANGLIYFIVRTRGYDRDCMKGVSGYFRVALVPVVVLSLVAGGLGFSRAPALAVALPIIVCADIVVGASRGFGSMRPTALLGGLLQPVAQLVLVAAVALAANASPAGVSAAELLPIAWALPYLPVLVVGAIWLARRVPRTAYLPGTARDFWRYTGPRSLAAALQAVFQRLDIVIVAMLAGPVEAAVYTAATRFKVVGQLAGQGLAQAVQPRLVRALADGDLERARRLYQTATAWLVILTWPIWLGYAAFAPWILRIFGAAYAGGAAVALVLAVTMMFATACGMVDVVLIAAGRTTSSLANIALATALTAVLDTLLVPAYGALGAALGWAAGVVVKNLLPLVQISRWYGLRPIGPLRPVT
jgi:O-antigen/teichoic acid export membrane protein